MQGAGDRSEGVPGRLLAVGDVHGCIDELSVVLDAIGPTSDDKVVFLGDYVDRGPNSRGVIDLLIALRDSRRCQTVFLRGNHEDMFLGFLGERGGHGDAFLFNGGRATLASYGLPPELRRSEVRAQLPDSHLQFLRGLELRHEDEPFLFVHAGVSPIRQLADQDPEDLLWIRDEFIRNRHPFSWTIVFGHTPQREVLWDLPFKIGLDTGCVFGNKLSCLDFTAGMLLQVERDSCRLTRSDVSAAMASLKQGERRV
jgi:diadenosine tetraphosphatase ApaH/serine/threonine PP2A family protein phosphatase